MHTVVGGSRYYPEKQFMTKADMENVLYRIAVELHGESGHAFTERSKKQIAIWIDKKGVNSFFNKYEVVAAGLDWDVAWTDSGRKPIIHIYEMPAGVSRYDKRAKELQHEVLTLKFAYDEQSDKFVPYKE